VKRSHPRPVPARLRPLLLLITAAMLVCTPCADAKQHLVRAGTDWKRIAERAEPGDEIILMPGRHLSVSLSGLSGTADRPIIIRGVDPANPVEIDCDLYGIRLQNCSHLRLRHLSITGARIAGILIEGDIDSELGTSHSRDIHLQDVHIHETGPSGQRHAIHLRAVDSVRISACIIRGWGGSGIEAVAVRDLLVEDCVIEGTETCTQTQGIRLRAGTKRAIIRGTTIRHAGEHGIMIGGASRDQEFRSAPATEAEHDSILEVADVEITDCFLEGSRCACALAHAARIRIHRNTILRPRQVVLSVRRDRQPPNAGDPFACHFGENIIAWHPGDLEALLHLGRDASPDGIELTQNLWWREGAPVARPAPDSSGEAALQLGPWPGRAIFPQLFDPDPRLNDEGRPTLTEPLSLGRPRNAADESRPGPHTPAASHGRD